MKVLLQAYHVDSINVRFGCFGVHRNYSRCIGRRTRQEACVSAHTNVYFGGALNDIHRGAYAAIGSFLMFSMVQFRDGPFIRPHPAFWRIALGINLLYELALVFLLFQDLGSARKMMTLIDSTLGVPLPETNYAENCDFTPTNVWVS